MQDADDATDWAVLADPTRARILALIRESPDGRALVGGLAQSLDLRQPTISHHMKELTARGIVRRRPEGRRVWYSIEPRNADRVDALLGGAGTGRSSQPDLARIIERLAERYRGVFSAETIRRYVVESHELLAAGDTTRLSTSRTADFAIGRLDALARSGTVGPVPEVLFVCVENAGRSQLAAGIMRQLAGDRVLVRTAGSAPADAVRATIATALDEVGVSLGGEFPKPLTDEAVRAADVVVTMGCGDACPVYPGRRYLDWDLEDPVGKSLEAVRTIRDDIEVRVRALLGELITE